MKKLPTLVLVVCLSSLSACVTEDEFTRKMNCMTHSLDSAIDKSVNRLFSYDKSLERCTAKKNKIEANGGSTSRHPFIKSALSPLVVQVGEPIKAMACFEVRALDARVNVQESMYLKFPDGHKELVSEETKKRNASIWLSETEFSVPKNAPIGTYLLEHQIRYGALVLKSSKVFEVAETKRRLQQGCS